MQTQSFISPFPLFPRHHECNKEEDDGGQRGQQGSDSCSMVLYPEEESWHYVTITPTRSDRIIEFAIGIIITGIIDFFNC